MGFKLDVMAESVRPEFCLDFLGLIIFCCSKLVFKVECLAANQNSIECILLINNYFKIETFSQLFPWNETTIKTF